MSVISMMSCWHLYWSESNNVHVVLVCVNIRHLNWCSMPKRQSQNVKLTWQQYEELKEVNGHVVFTNGRHESDCNQQELVTCIPVPWHFIDIDRAGVMQLLLLWMNCFPHPSWFIRQLFSWTPGAQCLTIMVPSAYRVQSRHTTEPALIPANVCLLLRPLISSNDPQCNWSLSTSFDICFV